jgi:hypothetical protein
VKGLVNARDIDEEVIKIGNGDSMRTSKLENLKYLRDLS